MPRSSAELAKILEDIDGTGYGAYKKTKGTYAFDGFDLEVEHVQGDPYASPSKLKVYIDLRTAAFPAELYQNDVRRVALEDYLVRRFNEACRRIAQGNRGSGKSGLITTLSPGQAALRRTTCDIEPGRGRVVMRFVAGLPAKGRTPISAIQGREMLMEEVPEIVRESLFWGNLPADVVTDHVETIEDAEFIRNRLDEEGLVAFVADGSVLPRESGASDRPMGEGVVPFESPERLKVSFQTPNSGRVEGMGVPEGVTLIVGGGYHGKSTLLNALAQGVYNHVPDDGREFVITRSDAVGIRAEDGRFVSNVDISPFIGDVPAGIDTADFSSRDASGSTSQAANIVEALEVGSRLLLVDEDTSATNLMIRDARMQELVRDEEEPISPLIDNIEALHRDKGVSSILVMGGSGSYFGVADTVIKMKNFLPEEVSDRAKEIYRSHGEHRRDEAGSGIRDVRHRRPRPGSIDPRKGSKVKIKTYGDTIRFGTENIELSRVAQIAEDAQIRSIGDAVFHLAKNFLDGDATLDEALDRFDEMVENGDLMNVSPYDSGEYAAPRRFEVAAALNRLRTLKCRIV